MNSILFPEEKNSKEIKKHISSVRKNSKELVRVINKTKSLEKVESFDEEEIEKRLRDGVE